MPTAQRVTHSTLQFQKSYSTAPTADTESRAWEKSQTTAGSATNAKLNLLSMNSKLTTDFAGNAEVRHGASGADPT